MATTDYDHLSTRNQIVERALRIIGALYPGDTLSAERQDTAVRALNDMVKSWQNEHVFLWTLSNEQTTLTTATSSYAVPTDPAIIGIERAWFNDDSNDDIEIDVISIREYENIPSKSDSGDPVCCAYNARDSKFYIWPVPSFSSGNKYLKTHCIAKLKDFDSASGTGDFTSQWLDALVFGLASRLAPEYGLPLGERRELRMEAVTFFNRAKLSDSEHDVSVDFIRGAFD